MLQGGARIAIGFNIVSMSSLELFFMAGSVLVVKFVGDYLCSTRLSLSGTVCKRL